MLKIYPVVITKMNDPSGENYLVRIPDFDGYTEGKTLADAINMARDYIGTTIMDKLDDKEFIPKSNSKYIKTKSNQICKLIDIDVSRYCRLHDKAIARTH